MRAEYPQTHIVVDDPEGTYWAGGLVSAEHEVPALRARGVATLPIEASLIAHSAVAGFFQRSWGAGWPVGFAVPRMNCPLMLYVLAGDGLTRLNVAVRIVPDSAAVVTRIREEGLKLVGSLRLTADTGQPGCFGGGFSAMEDTNIAAEKLGPLDARGGWTAYAGGRINAPSNSMVGFGLYGAILGARVAWAAISQSR